jgi:GNAT superfamily N-acetyltransferase
MPQELLDGLDADRRAEGWREILAGGGSTTLVAVDGDRLTGFVNVVPPSEDSAEGTLAAIYVEPELVGTGLGRALHDAGLERLRASGAGRAELDVLPGNARARRFYERAGWHAEGDVVTLPWGRFELPHQKYRRDL